MTHWVSLCPIDALPVGEHKTLLVDEHPVAVFNLEGSLHAVEDCCTHKGLPISEGPVDNDCITCPFHGAQFCLKTGKAVRSPAFVDLRIYAVRTKDGMVEVQGGPPTPSTT